MWLRMFSGLGISRNLPSQAGSETDDAAEKPASGGSSAARGIRKNKAKKQKAKRCEIFIFSPIGETSLIVIFPSGSLNVVLWPFFHSTLPVFLIMGGSAHGIRKKFSFLLRQRLVTFSQPPGQNNTPNCDLRE